MRIVQFAITACVAHHIWYVILSSCLTASEIVVSPRNQTVKERDDAFFNCTKYETNGSDISGLRYSWSRRNGEAVLSNTSRLNLKNVSRTDAGIYTCTVTNVSANWSEVVNATLIVWRKNSKISMVGQAWKDPNHKVLSDIVIAGIAVGGSVFFLVIIFMSLLCVIRRRQKEEPDPCNLLNLTTPARGELTRYLTLILLQAAENIRRLLALPF
ncbi:uncharacterized protein [Montipora capricornis]|uniref:uncharacterized protein n=1 Tax=Montipora capricornis TaxID=246305 RepID=UPI0035F11AB8